MPSRYFKGILFLTTNRVQTFDDAFLSRIHVGLHFQELSHAAKAQVWRAFLAKVGVQLDEPALARPQDRMRAHRHGPWRDACEGWVRDAEEGEVGLVREDDRGQVGAEVGGREER